MSQKDLFEFSSRSTVLQHPASETAAKKTFSFLEQTRVSLRLDHLLTISIALMVSMALVYTGGIEKGKHLTWRVTPLPQATVISEPATLSAVSSKQESLKRTPLNTDLGLTTAAKTVEARPQSDAAESVRSEEMKPEGSYTVQLATYKSESLAKKKVEELVALGYQSFTIPSGAYYQVCIEGFKTKKDAAVGLKTFKMKKIAPHDAYVRTIPS